MVWIVEVNIQITIININNLIILIVQRTTALRLYYLFAEQNTKYVRISRLLWRASDVMAVTLLSESGLGSSGRELAPLHSVVVSGRQVGMPTGSLSFPIPIPVLDTSAGFMPVFLFTSGCLSCIVLLFLTACFQARWLAQFYFCRFK